MISLIKSFLQDLDRIFKFWTWRFINGNWNKRLANKLSNLEQRILIFKYQILAIKDWKYVKREKSRICAIGSIIWGIEDIVL